MNNFVLRNILSMYLDLIASVEKAAGNFKHTCIFIGIMKYITQVKLNTI